jgi:DNA-binding transcriptional regulator YiaG
MTKASTTPVAVETVATVASTETIVTPAAPAAPKAPSKKSLATAIFAAKMTERTQGLFASNKEFRAAVLNAIVTDLGVSIPSAATMYNACKAEAEKADASVGLGRDPKVVKVKVEGAGKRGRPQGSVNKKKDAEVVVTDATVEVATVEVAAEADTVTEAVAA